MKTYYNMVLVESLNQLDDHEYAEIASMLMRSDKRLTVEGALGDGKALVCAYNKLNCKLDGYISLNLRENFGLEAATVYSEGNSILDDEFLDYLKTLAEKKFKRGAIKIQLDEGSMHLRACCEKKGFLYSGFTREKVVMKAYCSQTYANIAKILTYIEGKVSKSGRASDYFSHYYDEKGKKFVMYLEKETGLNVSTYLNSPKFYGALMLSQELAKEKISPSDFLLACQWKKSNPNLWQSLKDRCPQTFASFEHYIWEIYKIFDAKQHYAFHLKFKEVEDNLQDSK
ncbi:MAG: hypothetical protein J6A28_00680 [Clostridia bacterium]|nr:hypothetical protein [Clostridia bacterium]